MARKWKGFDELSNKYTARYTNKHMHTYTFPFTTKHVHEGFEFRDHVIEVKGSVEDIWFTS